MKVDEIERVATLTFWNNSASRPRGNSSHVFLAQALDEVGRHVLGGAWTGREPLEAIDGLPVLPREAWKRPYPKFPPPPPLTLCSRAYDRESRAALERAYENQGKYHDAHVHDWREDWRTSPIVADYERRKASWARLEKAMLWIAEHGVEENMLITRGRSVLGGEYYPLPLSVWDVEHLWSARFRRCQFTHRGLATYIFLTRESLDRCLNPDASQAKVRGSACTAKPSGGALKVPGAQKSQRKRVTTDKPWHLSLRLVIRQFVEADARAVAAGRLPNGLPSDKELQRTAADEEAKSKRSSTFAYQRERIEREERDQLSKRLQN